MLVHPQITKYGSRQPGTGHARPRASSNPSETSFTLFLTHLGPAMRQPRTDPAKRGLLSERELYWRERHDWLKGQGYELRPRFSPGWTPSWKGTK